MTSVGIVDLSEAVRMAAELSAASGHPLVVIGALAMAAHGYQRQTSDVDIVLPVVIGTEDADEVEAVAEEIGLEIRAKHSFGGYDFRAHGVRIDALTLNRSAPGLIAEAVQEAVDSDRQVDLFGTPAFIVSLGHLIALKLVAERRKDKADIVELLKVQIEDGIWAENRSQVRSVVERHMDRDFARMVDEFAEEARLELGR
jgi:hypothetical protein